jgi:hypothetical protein
MLVIATSVVAAGPAQAAVVGRMHPRPEKSSGPVTVVERVEVPVPVDDPAQEVFQALLAATAAAAAATATTRARLRRRYARPPANAIIELTRDRHAYRRTST